MERLEEIEILHDMVSEVRRIEYFIQKYGDGNSQKPGEAYQKQTLTNIKDIVDSLLG